jgi:hypothetical protein
MNIVLIMEEVPIDKQNKLEVRIGKLANSCWLLLFVFF